MPPEIEKLANELLNDPTKVSVTPSATTVEKISQQVLFIEAGRKRALLAELFEDATYTRTLVFTRTKRGADRVAQYLEKAGVKAASIHGDKSQGQRERALAQFKAGEVRALIATDIAARGIDVSMVSHVVQYELPQVPESYVHRIGRTARAGSSGFAISFCADDERNLLKDIQRVTRQTIPTFDRRNDKALGVMTAAMGHLPSPEQALPEKKSGGRGRGGGGGRGDNRGGNRGGGAPRNGGGDRPAAVAAPGGGEPWKRWGSGGKKPGKSNSSGRSHWSPLEA